MNNPLGIALLNQNVLTSWLLCKSIMELVEEQVKNKIKHHLDRTSCCKRLIIFESVTIFVETIVHLANPQIFDHCTFLGNCLTTPPLSQHFALSEK